MVRNDHYIILGGLLSSGCVTRVLLLGGVHVDVDGGCGLVHCSGQGFHAGEDQGHLPCNIHHTELWYGNHHLVWES